MIKLYQYKDLVKQGAFVYNGTLAVESLDLIKYNVFSPVNTGENNELYEGTYLIQDTLSNQEDSDEI